MNIYSQDTSNKVVTKLLSNFELVADCNFIASSRQHILEWSKALSSHTVASSVLSPVLCLCQASLSVIHSNMLLIEPVEKG